MCRWSKPGSADKSGNLQFRRDRAQLQPGGGHGRQDHAWSRSKRSSRPATLEPDHIHLPGIYVHRIVLNATPEKRIEKRTITREAGV
jgi:3-oxoacid CoA-transferase subunit A